jgi:hypothetical protein
MDVESTISSVVDLFREIIYDILGLFTPGAALLIVAGNSAFPALSSLIQPLTRLDSGKGVALFIGTSYVLGYAVQGMARHIWVKVSGSEKNISEPGTQGVSPAGLQVRAKLIDSDLYKTARTQLGEYCNVDQPDNLSVNDVQNLAFAVAERRAVDASRFAFRADLSVGLMFVCGFGVLLTLFECSKFEWWDRWVIKLAIYAILALGFGLRAWFYFDIRGRITIPIALAVLAERREKEKPETRTVTPFCFFFDRKRRER